MFNLFKNKKGFTLIEIIVSIAILGIIIVPISSLFVTSVRMNKQSEEMMMASQKAQQIIEALRSDEKLKADPNEELKVDPNEDKSLNYEGYKISNEQSNEDKEYYAIITLEEDEEYKAKTYYFDGEKRRKDPNIPTIDTSIDSVIQINVKNTITINGNKVTVGEKKNMGEPVKIRVECYGSANISFEVKNELSDNSMYDHDDEVHLHIVKIIKDGKVSNSNVTVKSLKGKVFDISNIYYKEGMPSEQNQLNQITVKISRDDDDENELIEIRTLKKKE
ncbi:type II secretion system protein [Lutibacter sp. B2]|nr:type II secretion system protein [Lutibacter sp. B2]